MVSEGLLKEVPFEEKLNDPEEPAMRTRKKTFFFQVKKTMITQKLRQELIWFIHIIKILLACPEKIAGARPWNALKARVRSLLEK